MLMTKNDLRKKIADITAWLDILPADQYNRLEDETLMDLVDRLVNIIALCQAEILKKDSE